MICIKTVSKERTVDETDRRFGVFVTACVEIGGRKADIPVANNVGSGCCICTVLGMVFMVLVGESNKTECPPTYSFSVIRSMGLSI
jgi:hypothetical protein